MSPPPRRPDRPAPTSPASGWPLDPTRVPCLVQGYLSGPALGRLPRPAPQTLRVALSECSTRDCTTGTMVTVSPGDEGARMTSAEAALDGGPTPGASGVPVVAVPGMDVKRLVRLAEKSVAEMR